MTRLFLSAWANPQSRAPLLAMLRSATTNEQAARMLQQFVTTVLLARIAEPLGIARLRIETAVAQMIGIALLRHVIQLQPMANATDDELVALVAPLIQHVLDGTDR
jgi:uracil phosphoribosyltransferase